MTRYRIEDLSLYSIGDPIMRIAAPGEASLDHIVASPGSANGAPGGFAPLEADSFKLAFSLHGPPASVEAKRLERLCGLEVSFTGAGPAEGSRCTGHGTLEQLTTASASGDDLHFAVVMDRTDLLIEPENAVSRSPEPYQASIKR